MELAIWVIVGLIVGVAIGALATWSISRARGGVVSVMELKQENEKFREEVAEHFVETAQLINQMSESYKQVFDHLSRGAEKLVDDEKLAERLPPATGQEVRLSHFGASATAGSAGEKPGKPGASAVADDGKLDSRTDHTPSHRSTGHAAEQAANDGGKPPSGEGPLKSGTSHAGAKTSPSAATDSEIGKDGKSGSAETSDSLKAADPKEKSADSDGKGASESNQASDDSRTRV